MAMMNCSVDDNFNLSNEWEGGNGNNPVITGTSDAVSLVDSNGGYTFNGTDLSCWGYYQDYYYPTVIRESYPVYLQERAKDKGKQAFEIIKILKDKKLVQLKTVGNFIDLMDELIKVL